MKDFAKEGWLLTPQISKLALGWRSSAPISPMPCPPAVVSAGLVNGAAICVLEQDKNLEVTHHSLVSPTPLTQPIPKSC